MEFKKTRECWKKDKKNVPTLEIKKDESNDPGNCNPTKWM